jgi:hypothetical protein
LAVINHETSQSTGTANNCTSAATAAAAKAISSPVRDMLRGPSGMACASVAMRAQLKKLR